MKQKILICGLVFLIIMLAVGIVFVKSGKLNAEIVSGQKAETVSKKAVSLSVASKKDDKFSLLFLGDAMLDRQIRTVIEKRGASFLIEKMKQFFIAPDGAVFNLEGPVTKNTSVSQNTVPGDKGHMSFTFDEEMTKNFLKSTKANAIFLGNNHILNFGKAGLSDTENFLKENSIGYFGDIKGQSEHLQKEIGGERIVFIAFNQFFGGTAQSAMDKIRELKKTNDFVVLYAHWGVEYAREESEQQKAWAHGFVDAGADLVIGSHPHVVQPVEIYKNKAIFYSLGNFVFDQYFSPETTSGLAVKVSAKENALDFNLSSLSLNRDGSTTLTEGKKKDDLLLWLSENSNASSELKNSLKTGYFQLENK